ncbi:hypothetical protein IG631_19606 [Alternaria alternata]|nr:hypothetical protein IG631_19606 [Alternaria alternata]
MCTMTPQAVNRNLNRRWRFGHGTRRLCMSIVTVLIMVDFSKQCCCGVASNNDMFSGDLVQRDTDWKTTIFVKSRISATRSMLAYNPPVEPVQQRGTYLQRSKLPLYNGDEQRYQSRSIVSPAPRATSLYPPDSHWEEGTLSECVV